MLKKRNSVIKQLDQIPQQTPNTQPKFFNTKDRINFYLNTVEDKIIKQIDQQKQSISQHHSSFFDTFSTKKIKLKQQQLKKLTQQKSKTQNKLKSLTDRQFQLQYQYRVNLKKRYLRKSETKNEKFITGSRTIEMKKTPFDMSNCGENEFLQQQEIHITLQPQPNKSSSLNKLRPKTQITSKDIQTLKNLKQSYIKFQQQLVNKTKKYNEEMEKFKIQNRQLEEQIKKQKNQQKRKQIQIKLQQLQKQKLSRIEKFHQEQIRLSQIKRRPKIHQKISKQFQQKQKALNQEKLQQLKEKLKKKVIHVQQINEHDKKYQQLRNQHLRQIHEKYLQQSRFLKQNKISPQKLSKFYRSVIQQQQQRKNQKIRKQQATIQKCQRIREFAAKVYQDHYPRVKQRQNNQISDDKSQQFVDRSLSLQQRKSLGNNYLRNAILSLKSEQKNKSTQLTTHENSQKDSQLPKIYTISTKYKDYLSEQRNRYKSDIERSQATEQKLKKKYMHSVEEIKKIMAQDITVRNKQTTIEKIQKIAQRMEHQPNDGNYIDKIRAKLKILETIT